MAQSDLDAFGMTSEERLAERRKALDKYSTVAQPAQQKVADQQTGQAFANIRGIAGQAAEQGGAASRAGISSALGKAAKGLATLDVQQAAKQDTSNLAGAKMEEDLVSSRQAENVQQFQRATDQKILELGEKVAARAFSMGMSTKELIFHQNAVVADAAFQQMADDFQNKRTSAAELQKVKAGLDAEAQQYQQDLALSQASLEGDLEMLLARKDFAAVAKRLQAINEMQSKAAEAIAKSGNIASIIEGVFTVGGAVIGGYWGPAGAVAGASIGNSAGKVVGGAVNS